MESSSSKRPRAPAQVPSCLVDGCPTDLSRCRDYHRRHKVCETHSKSPNVTISGQQMRFCQQCSRFHLVDEFDEGKRSCRKRLDGHNRRRRRPRPVLRKPPGNVLSNHHGIRSSPFINPNIIASNNLLSPYPCASITQETPKLPFLQEICSVPQPQLLGSSSSVLNRMVGPNSALSLLSSQAMETWEVGDSHMAQSDSFKYLTSDSLLGTNGGDESNQQGQSVFGIRHEPYSNQGTSPFQ